MRAFQAAERKVAPGHYGFDRRGGDGLELKYQVRELQQVEVERDEGNAPMVKTRESRHVVVQGATQDS